LQPQLANIQSEAARAECLGHRFDPAAVTYRQAITLFTEELPWLSSADQEWVMGRTVCNWLGWTLPSRGTAARGLGECLDD
jgi:hypothetical protein